MNESIIYELQSLYRTDLRIRAYTFGEGSKDVCVIGSLRGNEWQQMYICSLLVKKLKELEADGYIQKNHAITVIPCPNTYSVNSQSRFWPQDDTDINRMFPGYYEGETTQRIAEGIFDAIKDYTYGIQLTSTYVPGEFSPHIRVMKTGQEDLENSKLFGLPYIVVRNPQPYDTTTLNYNWQLWNCKAFSLFTKAYDTIHRDSAKEMRNAILRFLYEKGIISKAIPGGYRSDIIDENELTLIPCSHAGFIRFLVDVGAEVQKGDLLAKIYDPYDHTVTEEVTAPHNGVVFFLHAKDLVYAHTEVVKLIRQ